MAAPGLIFTIPFRRQGINGVIDEDSGEEREGGPQTPALLVRGSLHGLQTPRKQPAIFGVKRGPC